MLRSLTARRLNELANSFLQKVWPIIVFSVFILVAAETIDPDKALQMAIARCLKSTSVGPAVTLPCTGKTFDRAIATYLSQPENEHLEIVSIAPYSETVPLGSSSTKGFTVGLREKTP